VTALFAIPCFVAFVYAVWKNQMVHYALIDSFPPELSDEMTAKFALYSVALSPSTPLLVQVEYVKSLVAGAFAMLCFSLTLFSLGEMFGGWLGLIAFPVCAVPAIKSWRTYQENCRRRAARHSPEES
jgi:hypothetical protein